MRAYFMRQYIHGGRGDQGLVHVAVLNMIYSDYVKVAKKFNVGSNIDFYVDMAKAFLDDKDAGPDKLTKYYQYVVR